MRVYKRRGRRGTKAISNTHKITHTHYINIYTRVYVKLRIPYLAERGVDRAGDRR